MPIYPNDILLKNIYILYVYIYTYNSNLVMALAHTCYYPGVVKYFGRNNVSYLDLLNPTAADWMLVGGISGPSFID